MAIIGKTMPDKAGGVVALCFSFRSPVVDLYLMWSLSYNIVLKPSSSSCLGHMCVYYITLLNQPQIGPVTSSLKFMRGLAGSEGRSDNNMVKTFAHRAGGPRYLPPLRHDSTDGDGREDITKRKPPRYRLETPHTLGLPEARASVDRHGVGETLRHRENDARTTTSAPEPRVVFTSRRTHTWKVSDPSTSSTASTSVLSRIQPRRRHDHPSSSKDDKEGPSLLNQVLAKTAKRQGATDRRDAPPLHRSVRGNKKLALAVAASDEATDIARTSYESEWKSRGDTTKYYLQTWLDLHTAHWDGVRREALPMVPLTPEFIHSIGPLILIAGYRSPKK